MSNRLSSNHLLISALSKRQRSKNPLQAGFTLIELLIVIVIIGILSAIALPNFLSQRDKAENGASDAWASTSARACSALVLTEDTGDWDTVKSDPPAHDSEAINTCGTTGGTFTSTSGAEWVVDEDAKIEYSAPT